ncbi:hypothetical protein Ddye_007443 [Dipteronia dyeriana]|uniref:Uncharacterized protein n=1 Tax=Dipteronia dyeriana TaxID=168575 RepID=A0AAE0CRG9_9ROSI|nr:hypothetical protein Ddye_007443 [Dipteronia dyeriana]
MDQFEAFFRRADLDGDGRISGAEAVGFFQGSGLSKQVLAQIWMHADQNHAGFLGRQEFYNALKLVTVAQSKRELTPDMVKAALFGPAAAKIPPPQINLAAIPAPRTNTMAAASPPQMGVAAPVPSQNFGFRGPGVPNVSMGQQPIRPYQAAPQSHGAAGPNFPRGGTMVGQTQLMSSGTTPRPPQSMPAGTNAQSPNISNDWLSGRPGGAPTGVRVVSQPTPSTAPRPQTPVSLPFQHTTNDSKALVVSGNGFASDTAFGGDVFSALSTTVKKEPSTSTYSATSSPALPANVPVSSTAQPLTKSSSLDSLQSAFSMQPAGGQLQRAHSSFNPGQQVSAQSSSFASSHSSFNPGQQVSAQSSSSFASSGISVGVGNSTPDNSQIPWPKMKPSDVQKYSKVFMEVDTDRDGRITGEQARNLFTSWRLPREVLKQVWDLSDQDSDSMLSLREFCFALYLMERFREGRPLPALLPRNVMFDETLLSMTGQPNATYGHAAWGPGPNPGFQQQQLMGARSMPPAAGLRPPSPASAPDVDSFANQLDNGEQNSENSKLQGATAAETKAAEEKVILDSREKIEFYRTKMQELVLYKSRCDNRLNEITERAIADKREAETLAKKYEEKYKQVAEIASKLTIEEAKFRELQERKTELHQAIVNVERGGSTDGILQVRADRIQSDLEELLKALTERCKKHGIDVKSAALIELPVGWQPGIQEGASVWDEEWDKFEDEGFGNELTFDAKKSSTSPNAVQGEKASPNGSLTPDSLSNSDDKPRNLMTGEHTFESEDAYTHSEDESARSPHGSPAGRGAPESPSQEFSDAHFGRDSEADTETHRSFDESNWGAFDNNDDVDSIWGFNTKQGSDSDKHGDFFGSSNYDLNSVRTESPTAGSTFRKKSPFFDDSVPSTPLSRFGNSPTRFSEVSTDQFDSFSRFDSFNMHDTGFSSQPERLTRFDSMSSTNDFGYGGPERLTRFDSINSTRDFGGPDKLSRFDSISSSKDFGNSSSFYSFDDSDPFGSSGPFKVSSDSNSKEKF